MTKEINHIKRIIKEKALLSGINTHLSPDAKFLRSQPLAHNKNPLEVYYSISQLQHLKRYKTARETIRCARLVRRN